MDKPTIVLASQSPRRQALVRELGLPFEIRLKEVEEVYPSDLDPRKVPEFLAKLKAEPLRSTLKAHEILLTSDTIVILDGAVIGKPKNADEASKMLRRLSGKTHEVITGVALESLVHTTCFSSHTFVHFDVLSDAEIDHYVSHFSPFDKAGSYGIQEWIGYIGVRGIEGCYYNVMGLPLHAIYQCLKREFSLEA